MSSNGDFNSGGSVDCEGEVGDGEGGQKQVHLVKMVRRMMRMMMMMIMMRRRMMRRRKMMKTRVVLKICMRAWGT